jgi:hypothetical protein
MDVMVERCAGLDVHHDSVSDGSSVSDSQDLWIGVSRDLLITTL